MKSVCSYFSWLSFNYILTCLFIYFCLNIIYLFFGYMQNAINAVIHAHAHSKLTDQQASGNSLDRFMLVVYIHLNMHERCIHLLSYDLISEVYYASTFHPSYIRRCLRHCKLTYIVIP